VYAYVPVAHSAVGAQVEVDIFGDWVGGEVAADPLYDPNGGRVRA
jgi:4-methylaminobutanoate oxidase (formaldehyde-forming)